MPHTNISGYTWELIKLSDEEFCTWFVYRYYSGQYISPYAWHRVNTIMFSMPFLNSILITK